MTQLLPLLHVHSVFGSHTRTQGEGCNCTARACHGKGFLQPGVNLGCAGSAPNLGTGLSLTSPGITVEHGHVDVCGAGVSQQAVIQGRALTCRHVVSERQEA